MTLTTAGAGRIARVTVTTIRTWCHLSVVTAVKTGRGWVIEIDSLARRVTLGRTLRAAKTVINLSAFRDAKAARTKAIEMISEGGIIPASRSACIWLCCPRAATRT